MGVVQVQAPLELEGIGDLEGDAPLDNEHRRFALHQATLLAKVTNSAMLPMLPNLDFGQHCAVITEMMKEAGLATDYIGENIYRNQGTRVLCHQCRPLQRLNADPVLC